MGTQKNTSASGIVVKSNANGEIVDGVTLAHVIDAFGTSNSTELERLRIIGAAIDGKLSQSQTLAAVMKANGGKPVRGFSKGTVSRYAPIAAQVRRDDLPKVTPGQHERAALALVNLANVANVPDMVAAHDLALKETTGAKYVAAIERAAREAGKASYKALTAPKPRAARPNAGTDAAETGDADGETAAGSSTPTSTTVGEVSTLAQLSPASLIAELTRRYSGKAASILADDADALDALMETVEALIASNRLAGTRVGDDAAE
jgi:hypothetical protein